MLKEIILNPEQQAAVDHIEGPLLCLAGPGTGKTQIIAMRIANILKETQMNPYNILCLTFTETGAVAMRKRLIELIGVTAYYVKIFTFHSFCNELIQSNPEKFSFKRDAQPLDDIERIQIFNEIIDELSGTSPLKPFGDSSYYKRDFISMISELKREAVSPEKYSEIIFFESNFLTEYGQPIEEFTSTNARNLTEEDFRNFLTKTGNHFSELKADFDISEPKQRTKFKEKIKKYYESIKNSHEKHKEFKKVYESYELKLTNKNRYDYDDMILEVLKRFREDAEFLARYQEQFQYILLDEYQDTNSSQNEIIKLLCSYFDAPNIFAVGDDKQSIYRFQGASIENILDFNSFYQDQIKIVKLKENYRSTQTILNASQSLINNNRNLINDPLHSNHAEDTKIATYEFSSHAVENYFLAKKIKELIAAGTDPNQIAVIYRENKDAHDLIDLFSHVGIPFRVSDGDNILENIEIKKLLNIMRFVNDFSRSDLLFEILHYDFFGFNALDIAKASINANKEHKSIFEFISETEPFVSFTKKILDLKSISMNKVFVQFFENLINETGFLSHITSSNSKVELLNQLSTLFAKIKEISKNDHDFNLKKFIGYIDLMRENNLGIKSEILPSSKDAVSLLTAHKSKGLEFEYVFIIKAVDGKWGNKMRKNRLSYPMTLQKQHDENEEERRLFYVAMTRAKKQLHISFSKTNENGRELVPSIFLQEIEASHIENIDTSKIETEALERLTQLFAREPEHAENQDDLESYLKGILFDYKLNVSNLNTYIECPKKFYYKNLLKVPAAKTKSLCLGSAVHAALQDFLKNPNKEFLLHQFEYHLNKEILTDVDYKDSLQKGAKILQDYFDEYSQTFNLNSLAEYDFKNQNVFIDEVPITGQIDKIEILNAGDKTVNVVDYKTGNPDSKSHELKKGGKYWRQLIFYKLLCQQSKEFPFKMLSGEIDFVERGRTTNAFKKFKMEITDDDIAVVKTEIKDVYNEIKTLKFLKFTEERFCGECEWCIV